MGTLVSPPRFMKAVLFGSWLSFHTFRRQRLAVRHFPLVSSLVGEVSAKVGFYSREAGPGSWQLEKQGKGQQGTCPTSYTVFFFYCSALKMTAP